MLYEMRQNESEATAETVPYTTKQRKRFQELMSDPNLQLTPQEQQDFDEFLKQLRSTNLNAEIEEVVPWWRREKPDASDLVQEINSSPDEPKIEEEPNFEQNEPGLEKDPMSEMFSELLNEGEGEESDTECPKSASEILEESYSKSEISLRFAQIKSLSSLTSKEPSPTIIYHILHTFYLYVFHYRLHNGEVLNEMPYYSNSEKE